MTEDDIAFLNQNYGGGKKTQVYHRRDPVIDRLHEALNKANMTSDDVCNLLTNDLYEQEKLKY